MYADETMYYRRAKELLGSVAKRPPIDESTYRWTKINNFILWIYTTNKEAIFKGWKNEIEFWIRLRSSIKNFWISKKNSFWMKKWTILRVKETSELRQRKSRRIRNSRWHWYHCDHYRGKTNLKSLISQS